MCAKPSLMFVTALAILLAAAGAARAQMRLHFVRGERSAARTESGREVVGTCAGARAEEVTGSVRWRRPGSRPWEGCGRPAAVGPNSTLT